VAKAFYVGELESELRRIGKIDYRFHLDSDLEKCMEMVESVCRESLYPYPKTRVQKSVRREVSVTLPFRMGLRTRLN